MTPRPPAGRPGSARRRSRLAARLSDAAELLRFLARRRSFWVAVLVALLLALSLALVVVQSSAVTPFVYPLF